ncbi:MAG: cyanophycinase [Saprospiraceae bacterium]
MNLFRQICCLTTLIPLLTFSASASVLDIKITSRETILNGKNWGGAGAYEVLKGTIYYGFDPAKAANRGIVDLQLAPRNSEGLVLAQGTLVVVKPIDVAKGSGLAMVEVSNRGGKFTPSYFNQATKSTELLPDDPAYWGDGLLMEQGMTLIWVGWQFDVPISDDVLRLEVPKAKNEDGSPVFGWVRSDWTVDQATEVLSLGHRAPTGYPAIDLGSDEHQLTVRDGRDAPRQLVPGSDWQFAVFKDGKLLEDAGNIWLKDGFKAGKIYELVYKAKDPAIVGLGMAAIRDVMAYAKYDASCPFPVRQGIAAGVSQTGRFLRTFLYHGMNTDEAGRKVYDGMMIITAGAGRGSFNHRFAQPSRDGHRYSAFFYPTDIFPFTGQTAADPFGGTSDGLFLHTRIKDHLPKVFYINTGYEYWGRSASLIHTTPDGLKDLEPLPNERIYHIASGQHFVDAFPPRSNSLVSSAIPAHQGNPLQFKPNYRALMIQLADWVKGNVAPPDSKYPRLAEGTLVTKEALAFPKLAGIEKPTVNQHPYQADYGPRWALEGIIDHQPPKLGYAYVSLVPQVDDWGNELGGIRNVELTVPLATHTGWSLRTGMAANPQELTDFRGLFIPFSRTEQQRLSRNDPRPSINNLYKDKVVYLEKVEAAIDKLVKDRFLLAQDKTYLKNNAEAYWDYMHEGMEAQLETRGPANGSLIVIGGGRLDVEIYEKFKELAGGEAAKIVIIPSASEDRFILRDDYNDQVKQPFEKVGIKDITVLHTRDPKEADSEAFVKPLQEATGVWFVGGRQWRLVDAYAGTRTFDELQQVLARNGVIAGTSAGATIQGSYLARGDSKTNTVMMGDHVNGFGYITNIAIDQHLLARNRQFDLFEVLDKHPHLLGVGLDEGTAIVVKKDEAAVIGRSYVVFYDHHSGDRSFMMLKKGDRYDLRQRRMIRD